MLPIDVIASSGTLSIVGLEKNTGKTVCLNHILSRLPEELTVAVTSIGLDGEQTDSVTATAKPEIEIRRGTLFATSESDFARRGVSAEVLDVGSRSATGRVITSRALTGGKIRLSGPSSAAELSRWIELAKGFGAKLTIVDGALSRLSSASPAVSRAMILSTGAALSANIPTLVRQTAWAVEKILLEQDSCSTDTVVASLADKLPTDVAGKRVEVAGALTDAMLRRMISSGVGRIVVADFTRLFCSQSVYRTFCEAGGSVAVRRRSRLLAVTVNPTSPSGIRLDSAKLCRELEQKTNIPTYDLCKEE